ncbi:hypothetical protein D3C72_1007510 [compost metagenome]
MLAAVAPPSRTVVVPACTSARPPGSTQSRSPVVTGRFRPMAAHSSEPAGAKLMPPATSVSVAMRDDGSAYCPFGASASGLPRTEPSAVPCA